MAKGSVRKKGKKWYYRFYVEDASGNSVQREFPGSESKSETEAMLRKAMADYEEKQFVAKSENLTLAGLLDKWIEEELKPGSLSNGTVAAYIDTARRIKKHPIADRKLKKITPDHLQSYLDLLSLGGEWPDGTVRKALSSGSMRQYSAVLQGAFRFAVFPKQYLSFNPMQYIVYRKRTEDYDLFSEDGTDEDVPIIPTISYEQFLELNEMLFKKKNPALLPIQIAYYTGLRIGELMALEWDDIDLQKRELHVTKSCHDGKAENGKISRITGTPKTTHSTRVIPIPRQLIPILRDMKKRSNSTLVITDKGKNPSVRAYQRSFELLLSKIGVPKHGFHSLRHTFATRAIECGMDVKSLSEILGHKNSTVTLNRYVHSMMEHKMNMMDKLGKNL